MSVDRAGAASARRRRGGASAVGKDGSAGPNGRWWPVDEVHRLDEEARLERRSLSHQPGAGLLTFTAVDEEARFECEEARFESAPYVRQLGA